MDDECMRANAYIVIMNRERIIRARKVLVIHRILCLLSTKQTIRASIQ